MYHELLIMASLVRLLTLATGQDHKHIFVRASSMLDYFLSILFALHVDATNNVNSSVFLSTSLSLMATLLTIFDFYQVYPWRASSSK
jgi:hypothetical protein